MARSFNCCVNTANHGLIVRQSSRPNTGRYQVERRGGYASRPSRRASTRTPATGHRRRELVREYRMLAPEMTVTTDVRMRRVDAALRLLLWAARRARSLLGSRCITPQQGREARAIPAQANRRVSAAATRSRSSRIRAASRDRGMLRTNRSTIVVGAELHDQSQHCLLTIDRIVAMRQLLEPHEGGASRASINASSRLGLWIKHLSGVR